MAQMKTPGVYIVEKDAFGNSVVEVPTAVPAFIGYTERAENGGKSLTNVPWRITSFAEYLQYYGGAPQYKFSLTKGGGAAPAKGDDKGDGDDGGAAPAPAASSGGDTFVVKGDSYELKMTSAEYRMYNAIRLFYQNGGGPCYIVSVGGYSDTIELPRIAGTGDFAGKGLQTLVKQEEPTMVLAPESVSLAEADCISLQQAMLAHCGKMQSRMAILDVYGGYKDRQDPSGDPIANFRNDLGVNFLNYSAAYYPWVDTTIVQDAELGIDNFDDDSLAVLQGMMMSELGIPDAPAEGEDAKVADQRTLLSKIPDYNAAGIEKGGLEPSLEDMDKTLVLISPIYNNLLASIKEQLNLLPPSSAMAGVYTMVDDTRGVWKAPANVSLSSVVKPAVNISHDDQEDLNVTLYGKSINAIRSFIGEGVLVWGARTLDGNSNDWRYINVRRTMIMLEQSIKAAAKAYVFEPNDANTWTTIKSMIDNFLFLQWKKGALVGAKPADAYNVSVGLGATMTGDDILNGIMRITILVAISRPAEFIEITFQQQMQKS